MPRLNDAWRTIHADREWWRKILVGGALWLTVIGWPIVEGHQLESIENSQRGFATPLPRWHTLGDKAIVGIFALVIDFFYFVFPLLVGGFVLFCGTLAASLTGSGGAARLVVLVVVAAMALYLVGVWLAGASPIAKQYYVGEGDLQRSLSGTFVTENLRSPARAIYLRARLHSVPPYVLAGMLLALSLWLFGRTIMGGLVAGWIGLSALLYARLIAIQLYLSATRAVEAARFDLRRRRHET